MGNNYGSLNPSMLEGIDIEICNLECGNSEE